MCFHMLFWAFQEFRALLPSSFPDLCANKSVNLSVRCAFFSRDLREKHRIEIVFLGTCVRNTESRSRKFSHIYIYWLSRRTHPKCVIPHVHFLKRGLVGFFLVTAGHLFWPVWIVFYGARWGVRGQDAGQLATLWPAGQGMLFLSWASFQSWPGEFAGVGIFQWQNGWSEGPRRWPAGHALARFWIGFLAFCSENSSSTYYIYICEASMPWVVGTSFAMGKLSVIFLWNSFVLGGEAARAWRWWCRRRNRTRDLGRNRTRDLGRLLCRLPRRSGRSSRNRNNKKPAAGPSVDPRKISKIVFRQAIPQPRGPSCKPKQHKKVRR